MSWVPIAMLAVTGFFLGGVIAFARAKNYFLAACMAIATVLSGVAAWSWWN